MDDAEISKQLELYSNSIVAFVVIQSLTFCYYFGTNVNFNNILRTYKALSTGLAVAALLVTFLALYANHFLGSKLRQLSSNHQEVIRMIYRGKAVTIVIFSALQICITVVYAVFSNTPNITP